MRRFTRRMNSRRSSRSPTLWVTQGPSWSGNVALTTTANTLFTETLMQTGTSSLTSGGDTFVMHQRFTVIRIVGDLILANTSAATAAFYTWGIIVADESAGTGQTFDPTLTTNADKSWLTIRHGRLTQVAVAYDSSNQTHLPDGAHFDIKVKRVLRPDQKLQLQLMTTQNVDFYLNARMLIKRTA